MENLVIVESPTKARTLSRFLGSDYKIEASMGHVRDLPKAKLGVDTEKDFAPAYVIPRDKRKIVERLKEIAGKAKKIILATDPDREGEAIAWHIAHIVGGMKNEELRIKNAKKKKQDSSEFSRIVFHEITKEAVQEALKSPRSLDRKLVDAQVARRVLDRLVGYKLSPLLWYKIRKGLSAGRVQSVTVRLIVEREREIEAFKPVEYWSVEALLKEQQTANSKQPKEGFEASLVKVDGKKAEIKNEKGATGIVKDLEAKDTVWKVAGVEQKDIKRHPYPPFTTSTMTQGAAHQLGFSTKKTMKLAQDLYEEGLITYHRTDSFNLAAIAVNSVRKFIGEKFGPQYLPPSPRFYKTKSKVAQEAHEAVRPTDVGVTSEKLQVASRDHQRLYDLIWKRFVACQMMEAVYDQITLDINANRKSQIANRQEPISDTRQATSYLFRAVGETVKFPGWQVIYGEQKTANSEQAKKVPLLTVGDLLELLKLIPTQHFTEPPPRFTEATLIKTLEEKGIGRPSTYAPIISTILERLYVELEERKFRPTPLGIATNDFLVKNFDEEIEVGFTAKMEDQLDEIADGKRAWVPMIREFYDPFEKHLEKVSREAERVKVAAEVTDEKCPEGHRLVIRYGRFGKFLACEKFPEHKFTKQFENEEFRKKDEELKKLNLKCPKSGDLVILRQTRRGRIFYGCSGYPKCKWAAWQLPKEAKEQVVES